MPDGFNTKIAGQPTNETHLGFARSSEEAETSPAASIEIGSLFDATDRLTEAAPVPKPIEKAPPSAPIVHSETDGRQQGAICNSAPNCATPHAASIGQCDDDRLTGTKAFTRPRCTSSPSEQIAAKRKAKPRQKTANSCAQTSSDPPSSAPIGQPSNGSAGDEGHAARETHRTPALVATVNRIVELQRMRRFCIKSQSRCDRSIESLIASYLGYSTDLEEKNRKALFRRAGEIRKRVEGGGGDQGMSDTHYDSVPVAIFPMILASAQARSVWDDQRKIAEREMEKLAKSLPVWAWVEGVRGLGAKGLAILVGEAGIPIGDYRTVSGLWSRLGLAVIDGERQQRKGGELGKVHKFSPGRRAEVWAVASDSLFRAQWRGANDETGEPAHPIGPYGEAYARRRELTVERMERTANLPSDDRDKWSKGRCHNDARRIMTKELVKDLWVEWRRAMAA